jgi:NAD(P)-dependent dehydrogenase (short-subunit alcohol dehydrogenase family)
MSDKKVAIVTGAAQGIGLAGAEKFAKEGWSVALADLNKDLLFEQVERLKGEGYDVEGYKLDVSDYQNGKEVVAQIVERFGRIDALFNDAGIIGHRLGILDCDPEEIKKATNVNVFGTLNMTQHVAKVMVDKKIQGSIVNVASIAAELASWDPFGYQISKYGVKGLTKSTAFQLGTYGIRVNAVAPGSTKTPMSKIDWSDPVISKEWEEQNLLHRWIEPEEIANTAYFLASPESSAITGAIVLADAGYTVTKVSNRKNIYG